MRTRYETMTSGAIDGYSNYMGASDEEYRHWLNFVGQSRDSDALERSNFAVATTELERLDSEQKHHCVHRYGHWAVGWIEECYVRPGIWKSTIAAILMHTRLADYPVLDENDFCELKSAEANEVWRDCFTNAERIAYMREHSDQFEPQSFADLRGCARGDYFIGYASELIQS